MKLNGVPGSSLFFAVGFCFCLVAVANPGCSSNPTGTASGEDMPSGGMGGAADDNASESGGTGSVPNNTGGSIAFDRDAGPSASTDASGPMTLDARAPDPVIPPGLVPVVVAMGHGGRSAVSCNGGRSLRINDFHKTPDDDHSAHALTGLAGGIGAIIATAGWGAPGRIYYSDDAVEWTELPAGNFTMRNGTVGPSTENTSAGFFDGTQWKAFWSHRVWASMNGSTWKETAFAPTNISHIRDVEFYPDNNVLIMRVERDENGGRNFLMMTSADLGQTYKIWSPITTGCPAFQWGPIAYSHGIIVAGGSGGGVCRSGDGGKSWNPVPNIAGVKAMFADRKAIYVVRGDELSRSEDGLTWTRVLKANAQLANGAWSIQTGAVVAASSNGQLQFFRSDDGITWTPSAKVNGGFNVLRMRMAHVKPNPKCPQN
ncbi:MAG: hypothetical protein SGI86_09805 [Deltaproteobacteria bacterium]|nr:hypothetical protein [Deltaproteobacteria bacterium]